MHKITILKIPTILLYLFCLNSAYPSDFNHSEYVQVRSNSGLETESGVGVSYRLNPYVDFRGIASLVTNSYDNKVRLNIGLVDIHNASESIGVRIGRVQNDLGFYTASYNWAPVQDLYQPPQGIYRENFRYLVRSSDGAQLYTKSNYGWLYLQTEFTVAKPVLFPQEDITKVWSGLGGEVTNDSWISGISVSAEFNDINTTVRYDSQNLHFNLQNTTLGMLDGGIDTYGHYLGVKVEPTDKWSIIGEYLVVQKTGELWNKMDTMAQMRGVTYTKENAIGYGLSTTYQATEKIKLIIGYSAFYGTPSDKHGKKSAALLGANANEAYMEDTFMSVKYRYGNWISTAEVHDTRGTATFSLADSLKLGTKNTYTIFTLTYLF